MGDTVIVLDTNQFRESPMLRSTIWAELLTKADEWDLRFVVPEVCFLEAVSVVRRKLADQRGAVLKFQVEELDLATTVQQTLEAIDSKISGYEDALRARLDEIGAEIVPVPAAVGLLDVVRRAINRRAPYPEGDGTKDAFRDTLIWYTAQSIATAIDDCEVWLVSTNHNDFGIKPKVDVESCPYPLHAHLTEDLANDGLSGRVQYVRTIGRLAQHLAGTYDALPLEDREALFERMDRSDFVRQVEGQLIQIALSPKAAALPVRTDTAVIHSLSPDPDSLRFVDAAMRGAGAWTAQFSQTIEAVVDLTDRDGDTFLLEKTLTVAGRLLAAADGSVTQLTVTSIEAPPDDPMRRAWVRRSSVIHRDWPSKSTSFTGIFGDAGMDSPISKMIADAGKGGSFGSILGAAGMDSPISKMIADAGKGGSVTNIFGTAKPTRAQENPEDTSGEGGTDPNGGTAADSPQGEEE